MNKTYWVVVAVSGHSLGFTVRWRREDAIKRYVKCFERMPTKYEIRQIWRRQYKRGARCVKVRLVLEGDE